MTDQDTCRIVRGNGSYEGRQGLTYFAGISAESVGARGIFRGGEFGIRL